MSERWERELRNLGAIDAPSSVDERVRRGPLRDNGGPSTRHRILVVVVAFAVFAAAGAFAFAAFGGGATRRTGTGTSSPAASTTTPVLGAATVLIVRCGSGYGETKILTPVVAAQRDGLHLTFEDTGKFTSYEVISGHGSNFTGVGGSISRANTGHSLPVKPGVYQVTCGTTGRISEGGSTFTLADPHGYWESPTLGCSNAISTVVSIRAVYPPAAGRQMRKDIAGILKSDVEVPVAYPDASVWKTATYWSVIERGGQSIASLRLEPAGHHFNFTVDACPGSGITASASGSTPVAPTLGPAPTSCGGPHPEPHKAFNSGLFYGMDPLLGAFGASLDRSTGTFHASQAPRTHGGFRIKVLWTIAPGWTKPVRLSAYGAAAQEGPTFLLAGLRGNWSGRPPSSSVVLDPAHPGTSSSKNGWKEFPSYLYVPRAGCYALQARWPDGSWTLGFGVGS